MDAKTIRQILQKLAYALTAGESCLKTKDCDYLRTMQHPATRSQALPWLRFIMTVF